MNWQCTHWICMKIRKSSRQDLVKLVIVALLLFLLEGLSTVQAQPSRAQIDAPVSYSKGAELSQDMIISTAVLPGISPAVRDLTPRPAGIEAQPVKESSPRQYPAGGDLPGNPGPAALPAGLAGVDPLVRPPSGALTPDPILSFEGIPHTGAVPPDTNGDVGPDHYVQMVNVKFAIWDKAGNLLSGPFDVNQLWDGQGNECEFNNDGDPIVVYDPLADRWLLSQFALPNPYYMCIAISQTPDPTGAYYLYQFQVPGFPDYPKFGVWPDGYYMSTNENGASAYAFDRLRMLAGLSATYVRFNINNNFLLPSDLDGSTPPPDGAPNHFYTFLDETFHGGGPDRLEIWDFHVDFLNPGNSTFALAQTIPVTPFNYTVCGYFIFECIPQPAPGEEVDAISEWPMWRFAYRNFGSHEALVGNFAVDVDNTNHSGIRWFELRSDGGSWTLHQEGTQAPDLNHRWVGSIAMDRSGNIALGYSVSSLSLFPAIRYAVREAGDPLGTLQAEVDLIAGNGVQTAGYNRWGDYSAISIDPTDDCTFWYTNEYYPVSSARDWHTRIGSFRIPSCGGDAPILTIQKMASTGQPTPGEVFTYTLEIANQGAITATGGVISDSLPAGLIFLGPVTIDPPVGIPGSQPPTLVSDITLYPAGSALVSFPVQVDPGLANGVSLINTATLTSTEIFTPAVGSNTVVVTWLADLSLVKADSPDPLYLGELLTYTLGVTNQGPQPAENALLVDDLPPSVQPVSLDSTQGSCSLNQATVSCDFGALQVNDPVTVTIVVRPMQARTIVNQAQVSSAVLDPDAGDNTASASSVVQPVADLQVDKIASHDPVFGGDVLTYTVTVLNAGPSAASNFILTDTLPYSLTILHVYPTYGSCLLAPPAQPTIVCDVASLGASSMYQVEIITLVDEQLQGVITNTVEASSDVYDPTPLDNSAQAVVTVYSEPSADLSITKSAQPETGIVGQPLTYTLNIFNAGPLAATGVLVTDTLSAPASVMSVIPSQGACAPAGQVITCGLGDLPSQGVATVTIVVMPQQAGNLLNLAEASALEMDLTPENNQATVTVQIRPAFEYYLPVILKVEPEDK